MGLTMVPVFLLWTFLSSLPLLSALALPSTAIGIVDAPPSLSPSSLTSRNLGKRCGNPLQNPSFETGTDPWLAMVSGSWSTRGVYTSSSGGHAGANFYYGHSNSTIDSTLTISQSAIQLSPANGQVECAAWVASRRPGNVGSTRVEVFLDGQSCGVSYLGTNGWTRVGGKVAAQTVEGGSTLAVVVVSDEAGDEGWTIWVDDLWVGNEC